MLMGETFYKNSIHKSRTKKENRDDAFQQQKTGNLSTMNQIRNYIARTESNTKTSTNNNNNTG